MMVAANAPDFDVVSWFGGSESYIHWHRNITHSLLALPLMALLSVVIVRWAGRRQVRWFPAFLIASVAVASHLILDLTNVYGVRLLLPFSGHWFHWDVTPVVDLIIWAILLPALAAPALGRLVSSEIGERRRETGGGWAIFALLLLGIYDYGRGILHDRAAAVMASRVYRGLSPRRAGAFPQANPLTWNGIAELSDAYVIAPIDFRHAAHPAAGLTFYKAERTPAIEAALATQPFQTFLQFVQYPIWVSGPAPDVGHDTQVSLVDLRFGTPAQPGFAAVARIDGRNRAVESNFNLSLGHARPR